MIGTRIGQFEVTAKLGEGGMGEVYRGHDTKLKRDVAIKVLPSAFTEDKERLARFEREAQLLAQLHHPNIASIFGLEETDSTKALVMELVEGPTLAERLESGALPLDESLSIAHQIAEALEEAHEKGIIHRDLKPQNIKASIEGKVKVLDFGLAKAMDPAGVSGAASASQLAASPTLTLGATVQGMILGTAAYMAPEQAKGFAVDRRADIWAFGVVLFEMLTGVSPFVGDSVPDTLARVLQRELDFAALPASTPPAIRRLLRRCLERQPKSRLHSIADARIVIDEVLSGRMDEHAPSAAGGEIAPPRARWLGAAGFAALLGIGAGYLVATLRSPVTRSAPATERRFVIPAENRSPTDRQAIAPDGERIVYTAGGKLWLRPLAEVDPRELGGGEGAADPFFSPDGREIGFVRDGALWRIGIEGGTARRICELPAGIFDGGTWGEDGSIVFAVATGGWSAKLHRCLAGGGNSTTLLESTEIGERMRRPQFLPGGAGLLYSVNFFSDRGEVRRLRDGRSELLYALDFNPRGTTATRERLYFVREQGLGWDLWSIELDDWKAVGEPVLVATNADTPSVSGEGSLLYAASQAPPRRLALVDRGGASRAVGEAFRGDVFNDVLQVAPGGERASWITAAERSSSSTQVMLVDLASGGSQRLSVDYENPLVGWSPDGSELIVAGGREGARIVPLGGGDARELQAGHAIFQPRCAPDGEWIVYYTVTAESGRDLYRIATGGASPPEPLLREPGEQANPDVSPDGRFLAYQSDESGRPEIYVRPYPAGGRKWQVSTKGGASPVWNRAGGELVWLAGNAIWSAPVTIAGGSFEAGAPRILLAGDAIGADLDSGSIYYSRMYDLSSDGRHFLVAQRAGEGRNEMVYVENPGGAASN